MRLWLQCYTAEEIASRVGMPRSSIESLFPRIRNYEISGIPGIFTEDEPPDSATASDQKSGVDTRANHGTMSVGWREPEKLSLATLLD